VVSEADFRLLRQCSSLAERHLVHVLPSSCCYHDVFYLTGPEKGAYDHDRMFPVYGFGAKIPPRMEVSHCFPLTFAPNPEVCLSVSLIDSTAVNGVVQSQLGSQPSHINTMRNIAQVAGVEGILAAYYAALDKVQLHGPTNFAQFLVRFRL
jgi:hypothetical protein